MTRWARSLTATILGTVFGLLLGAATFRPTHEQLAAAAARHVTDPAYRPPSAHPGVIAVCIVAGFVCGLAVDIARQALSEGPS